MTEGAPRRGRDYTHEIIGSGRVETPTPDTPREHRSSLPRILLLNLIRLIMLIIVIAGIWWALDYHRAHRASGIPSSVASSVNFPLYYPYAPPKGFTPGQSATAADNMITFSYKYNDQEITVEEQAMPASLKVPPNPQEVDLKIGKAWLTTINQQPTALIQTAKTLVIITAQSNLPQNVLSGFAQTFQSVN